MSGFNSVAEACRACHGETGKRESTLVALRQVPKELGEEWRVRAEGYADTCRDCYTNGRHSDGNLIAPKLSNIIGNLSSVMV